MPTITRWFRVTHDINSDPELWELRDLYGDRALFVWLECLSIADRNSGVVGLESPQLYAVLAAKCRVYSPKVRSILTWCLGRGWLEVREQLTPLFGTSSPEVRRDLVVVKWAKYNNTRERAQRASPPLRLPSPPDYKKTIAQIAPPKGSAQLVLVGETANGKKKQDPLQGFAEFWVVWPKRIDKKKTTALWIKIHPSPATYSNIMSGARAMKAQFDARPKEDLRFCPSPERWMRDEKYNDEREEQVVNMAPKVTKTDGPFVFFADGRSMLRTHYERQYGIKIDAASVGDPGRGLPPLAQAPRAEG